MVKMVCFDCMYMEKQGRTESYRQRIILDETKDNKYFLDNVGSQQQVKVKHLEELSLDLTTLVTMLVDTVPLNIVPFGQR